MTTSGRIITCDVVSINNTQNRVSIINIYAPNIECPEFFQEIEQYLIKANSHKMLVGDFNLTLQPEFDRQETIERHPKAVDRLKNIMIDWNLVDLWRIRNPGSKYFTWYRTKPKYIASRIDYMLISEGLTTLTENITHLTGIRTDHSCVFASVKIDYNSRGPGYWKLNTSLIENEQYIHQTKELINDKLTEYGHLPIIEKWELTKQKVAEHSKQFAKAVKNKRNLLIADISEELADLEEKIAEVPDHIKIKRIECLNKQLNDQVAEETRSLMFPSKAKWYYLGEKGSKYFLSLEKMRYNARTCSAVMLENGSVTNDPDQILMKQQQFYADLYSEKQNMPFNLINDSNVKLTDNARDMLDRPIEIRENPTSYQVNE